MDNFAQPYNTAADSDFEPEYVERLDPITAELDRLDDDQIKQLLNAVRQLPVEQRRAYMRKK